MLLRRWWPVLAAVLLLAAVAGSALAGGVRTSASGVSTGVRDARPTAAARPTSPPQCTGAVCGARVRRSERVPAFVAPAVVLVGLGGLVLLAYLVAVVLMAYGMGASLRPWRPRLRTVPRGAGAARAVVPGADRVRAAVDAGLDDLDDRAADPRRAVIACWLRLERAAAAAGLGRSPADTADALVRRVLADRAVPAEALERLAELYRRARYAPDEVGEPVRAEARKALAQVAAGLDRPAAPSGSTGVATAPAGSTSTGVANAPAGAAVAPGGPAGPPDRGAGPR